MYNRAARRMRRRDERARDQGDELEIAAWFEAYHQTIEWFRFHQDGRLLAGRLACLPVGELVHFMGIEPPSDLTADPDEAVAATLASAVDKEMARWKVEGDLLLAGMLLSLAAIVWNYAHLKNEACSRLLLDLMNGMPLPTDRSHVTIMVLWACFQSSLNERARADPRLITSVSLLGHSRGVTRALTRLSAAQRPVDAYTAD